MWFRNLHRLYINISRPEWEIMLYDAFRISTNSTAFSVCLTVTQSMHN